MRGTCTEPNCEQPIKGRGLCMRHYSRSYRRGELPGRVTAKLNGAERERALDALARLRELRMVD